jgi:multisubunit Na+/H+ antiporter MnhB subunit
MNVAWILGGVALILLALVMRDAWRHRRVTIAMRARLLVVLVFALVLAWLQFWRPG